MEGGDDEGFPIAEGFDMTEPQRSAGEQAHAEEQARFRETARRRKEQEELARQRRVQRAWEVARRAAALLRKRFHATRVVVFGSLARGDFTLWSDVDLAVWGLRPEDTFRAVAALLGLDDDIEVNLVDVQACPPSLLATIEREGVEC